MSDSTKIATEATVRQTSPPRAPRTRTRARLLAAALSTLGALLALELALRIAAQRANASTLRAALAQVQAPSEDPDAGLGNLIRLSENDRILYELQPRLAGRTFRGTHVNTDDNGFRISPPVPADERTLVTIVGIGDSIMFGHGVEDHQTYLYRLQLLLQSAHPERRWRVINTGVPGFNTVMEVETLRTRCLSLAPDLVILNIVGNDYEPPYFVREPENTWALDRSFLFDRLFAGEQMPASDDDTRNPALFARGTVWYAAGPGGERRIPQAYRSVFGKKAFEGALDALDALSDEQGFDVLVFTTYEWDATVEMVASAVERGFPHVSLMPDLRAWMLREKGMEFAPLPYSKTELVVGRRNSHPSALQHEMAAKRLYDDLGRLELLDALAGD